MGHDTADVWSALLLLTVSALVAHVPFRARVPCLLQREHASNVRTAVTSTVLPKAMRGMCWAACCRIHLQRLSGKYVVIDTWKWWRGLCTWKVVSVVIVRVVATSRDIRQGLIIVAGCG